MTAAGGEREPGTLPRILVTTEYFLPGYRGGGPITSIRNLLSAFDGEYDFTVLTRDRDLGSATPYPSEERLEVVGDAARVRYLGPAIGGLGAIRRGLRDLQYDVLHLNSVFSPAYTIWPLLLRRAGLTAGQPVILAPRGELHPGALAIKRTKKIAFLQLARALHLYDGVIWQASGEQEAAFVARHFPSAREIRVCEDLAVAPDHGYPAREKSAGRLRILFLSRIARNKNLQFVIETLQDFDRPVELTIAGPIEDQAYWRMCRQAMQRLPKHVQTSVAGPVPPDRVATLYRDHDLLFLPTFGENYGHVIVEALSSGCPVLISDRTPWRELEQHGAGWDLPLKNPDRFRAVLRRVWEMPPVAYEELSRKAFSYGQEALDHEAAVDAQRTLFEAALSSPDVGEWS